MQRPSTGTLLKGLHDSLTDTVLPALPRGVAQQQLRAALHLIGRLQRTWDLAASHLAADNADIAAVLTRVLGPETLAARLTAVPVEPLDGYNDPVLGAMAARNLALHQVLLTVPDHAEVRALHARMVARDGAFVGDGVGE